MGETTMDNGTAVHTVMDRRRFLTLSAAAGASLAAATTLAGPASDAFAGIRAHESRHPRWGAYCRPTAGQSWEDALTEFESHVGRTMSLTRHYYCWDEVAPDAFARFSAAGGRTPYISLHAFTRKGDHISWADIAAGKFDDHLNAWAASLRDWGASGYLNFHHEPENDLRCGTNAEFKAAFAHVRAVFDAAGVNNFKWGVSLMASTLKAGHGGADAWLPHPDLYRVIIVDGYNRFPSDSDAGRWRSFHDIFKYAHRQARDRGKQLLIGEYGTVEQDSAGYRRGSPVAKASWFDDATDVMKRWPELIGAIYSHTTAVFGGQVMNYWADTSYESLAAFTNCGHNRFFS